MRSTFAGGPVIDSRVDRGESVRLVIARLATPRKRRDYEQKNRDAGEPAAEYDFSKGFRGKYVERLEKGSDVVVLDPDVASEFDSPQAVNPAIRVYLEAKKKQGGE